MSRMPISQTGIPTKGVVTFQTCMCIGRHSLFLRQWPRCGRARCHAHSTSLQITPTTSILRSQFQSTSLTKFVPFQHAPSCQPQQHTATGWGCTHATRPHCCPTLSLRAYECLSFWPSVPHTTWPPQGYSHVMRVAGWRLGLKDSVRNRQHFRTRPNSWVPQHCAYTTRGISNTTPHNLVFLNFCLIYCPHLKFTSKFRLVYILPDYISTLKFNNCSIKLKCWEC